MLKLLITAVLKRIATETAIAVLEGTAEYLRPKDDNNVTQADVARFREIRQDIQQRRQRAR